MARFSRTRSKKRNALLTLACSGILITSALIAYRVVGADPGADVRLKYQAAGNPNYPFPTDAHLAPTIKAIVNREATTRATAATGIARNPQVVSHNPPPTAPPSPKSPINEVGIFPQPLPKDYGPIYKMDAAIENYYRTFDSTLGSNQAFIVVAGASLTDPQTGFVGVSIFYKTGLMPLNESLTPTKHGSVHIVSVNNNVALLQAQDGTQFSFDFVKYAFV